MRFIINFLARKSLGAAAVVLGAFAAKAELVKTPILQTFDGVEESVGYKVTGLNDGKEEALVFTNHLKVATWTVPARLKNVQFLVVGGGGGGGAGTQGAGGGGGGVVTGYVYSIKAGTDVDVTVGAGGAESENSNGAVGKRGKSSSFKVGEIEYAKANGGGCEGVSNGSGGSGGGAPASNTQSSISGGSATKGSADAEYVYAELFGNNGGKANTNPDGTYNSNNRAYNAGGGGGAKGVGGNGYNKTGGAGGVGLISNITGKDVMYGSGGGGGGGVYPGSASSGGGKGGQGSTKGQNGVANTGGGGGGGGTWGGLVGGAGGSGIVVFRYSTRKDGFRVIVR